MVNIKVDLAEHFEKRIRQWLVVRMKKILAQENMTESHLWTIAGRIVDSITWKEKREGAAALAAGRSWPAPPVYEKPTPLTSLLGTGVIGKLPTLNPQTQTQIWSLFEGTLLRRIGGALH